MQQSSRKSVFESIDVKTFVGSGCLWAWFDAQFMGVFFSPSGTLGLLPEISAWGNSFLGVAICFLFLMKSSAVRRIIVKKSVLAAVGCSGFVGSLCLIAAGTVAGPIVLVAGVVLTAVFTNFSILIWGAVYCRDGSKSALIYVAGGFAFALVPDTLFLLIIPPISAYAFSLLPLLSCGALLCMKEKDRTYAVREHASTMSTVCAEGGLAGAVRQFLGISPVTLVGIILVMVGFGYMQHQISFSATPGIGELGNGVPVQLVRGIVAVGLFALIALFPKNVSVAYKAGLPVFVLGFSLMPFLYGTESFWVSGAVIIGGYTTFDILVWIIAAQTAYTRSCDPLQTVCVMRILVNNIFTVLGAVIGIVFSGFAATRFFVLSDAIFVGYFMTVAIVLLLGNKDVWKLFNEKSAEDYPTEAFEHDERLDWLADDWSLTQREKDVFKLLAVGRTQPWIAESLSISESTVNTHVRHLYSKAGVNSRQELLDYVVGQSCDSVEKEI